VAGSPGSAARAGESVVGSVHDFLDLLVREKNIETVGDMVRLPGHGVVMKDEEAESKKKIEDAFAAAGLKFRHSRR